ncbi:MAG: BatD family protein [Gilvibacter sp.]
MKRILQTTIVFLCLGFVTQVSAQVTFVAKLSKSSLGVNERLRVDFEMNRDGDNFNPPSFDGFRVVGGPNQSVSNSWINGKKSYSKTFSYFLAPTGRGNFTIGQATIEVDGALYKTLPVKVEITAAIDKPNDGSDAGAAARENVHLVADVSKSNPYLNEAITIVYKLYVSKDVSVTRQWREIDNPKYADFWSQTIENRQQKVYEGKYKGKDYRYVILKRTILYPQKTGELKIEPYVLDVPVDVLSNKRDIFGRRLTTTVNQTVAAGNITLDVKPLPEEGRPADFSGAVGDFDFKVTTSREVLDANQDFELNVKVSGNGNLKLFDLPEVTLPSSLEVYEPKRVDNVKTDLSGMQGSIGQKYTVVPQFKGNYPIKAIRFTYFDLATESYKTISSRPTVISVENGPVSEDAESETVSENGTVKKTVVLANDQFKYLKLNPDLVKIDNPPFFKSTLYWSLLGGPLLLLPLFVIIGRKRREQMQDVVGNRKRKADKLAKKYLSEAKKNLKDQESFYEALERALHNYLKAKLQIETTEMDKTTIEQMLLDRGGSEEIVGDYIGLLKSCEFARYAMLASESMQDDYQKAAKAINNLDKQL